MQNLAVTPRMAVAAVVGDDDDDDDEDNPGQETGLLFVCLANES